MPNLLINGLSWAAKIIQFSIFLWPLNYELESFAVSELMKLKQKENLETRKARSVPFIGSKARNENIYIYIKLILVTVFSKRLEAQRLTSVVLIA